MTTVALLCRSHSLWNSPNIPKVTFILEYLTTKTVISCSLSLYFFFKSVDSAVKALFKFCNRTISYLWNFFKSLISAVASWIFKGPAGALGFVGFTRPVRAFPREMTFLVGFISMVAGLSELTELQTDTRKLRLGLDVIHSIDDMIDLTKVIGADLILFFMYPTLILDPKT